jgi:hypothetical protein
MSRFERGNDSGSLVVDVTSILLADIFGESIF